LPSRKKKRPSSKKPSKGFQSTGKGRAKRVLFRFAAPRVGLPGKRRSTPCVSRQSMAHDVEGIGPAKLLAKFEST
jgi:hypothetical protein